MASEEGANEGSLNVCLYTQDDWIPVYYDNAEFDSRMQADTPQNDGNKRKQQEGFQNLEAVNAKMVESMSSFPETDAAAPANLSKKVRSKMDKSSRGCASSRLKPISNTELVHGGRPSQKDSKLPHQDPLYKEQELKTALPVIRKIMKMDAAEPFNVPIDPIALGIPRVKKNFTKFWTEAGLHWEQPQEINEPNPNLFDPNPNLTCAKPPARKSRTSNRPRRCSLAFDRPSRIRSGLNLSLAVAPWSSTALAVALLNLCRRSLVFIIVFAGEALMALALAMTFFDGEGHRRLWHVLDLGLSASGPHRLWHRQQGVVDLLCVTSMAWERFVCSEYALSQYALSSRSTVYALGHKL
ncbi:DNA-binding bromodomain-containing protein [Actinidia rufa]|uniref:DNA-binding bromodomain-containing protein n=1 Tax=Actinidia rufa TaxID=165716 RepID=A0A7J0GFP2_9ERIC|nr:DNA-binding bromodomain-containing protein [Actinidia rufa]